MSTRSQFPRRAVPGSRLAAGVFVLAALAVGWSTARAEKLQVDTVHSSVLFRVKHLNTSYTWGRFNNIAGQMTLDDANPSIELTVKADSIDTANSGRDQHLKSPDFFNARQFPDIVFKSTSVKKLDGDKYEAEGSLTLHGVTKPLKVQLVRTGTGKAQRGGGSLAGFETSFDIKRSEFGMTYSLEGVSDEVKLVVALECAVR